MKRSKLTCLILGMCASIGSAIAGDVMSLSLDSLMNIPVNITSKYEQSSSEAPASVTVITSDEIRKFGWRTLEEVLSSVRSFYVSDDRNYSYLGVRGYLRPSDYNNRVLLLLNGATINEMSQGQPPINTLFALDLGLIDQIEIVRGPGSALYGTNAMFAVINIVTKSPRTSSGLSVSGTAVSPQGTGAAARYVCRAGHKWDITLSGSYSDQRGDDLYLPEYDTPETNNGVAENLDWEQSSGLFARAQRKDLKLQAYMMTRHKGIPTPAWYVTFNDRLSNTEDTYVGGDVEYHSHVGLKSQFFYRLFVNSFHYDGMYPYDPPTTDNPDYVNERRIGSEVRWHWTPRSYNRGILGVEYLNHYINEYYSADEEVVYNDESHPFAEYSIFAQDEHEISRKLTATVGFRHSWYSQGFNALVPRAALVLLPNRSTSLKALYGEAFRIPAITEYNYWYPDQTKPNPDLGPERIRNFEFVVEHRLSRVWSTSLSLYTFRISDMINAVLDPTDELIVYRNVGAADGNGIEAEIACRTESGVIGYGSYSAQYSEQDPGDTFLSNSPRHVGKAGVSAPIHRYVRIAAESQAESYRYTLLGGRTAPVALFNAALMSTPSLDPFYISLGVRNVFDMDYGNPSGWENLVPLAATDMPITPQRGRTISLRVELRLGGR